MQETPVQSLGWEDPLEKEMATHSSTSCLENPMDPGPGGLQSLGSKKGLQDLATKQQYVQAVLHHCEISVPWPGIEPMAVKAQNPNH